MSAFLSSSYCEPAVERLVFVSRLSLEPLSELGCGGLAEGDPRIQASACSSSAPSSVEETEKKKHQPLHRAYT